MSDRYHSCPECGKQYHACTSCGLQYLYELNYCSSECFKKTFTYQQRVKEIINILTKVYNNITSLANYLEDLDSIEDREFYFYQEEIIEFWKKLKEEKI